MKIILERTHYSDQGTFGILHLPDKQFVTGELPWRENRPNLSCIPTGIYECVKTYSPTFRKPLYLVADVKDRAGIRFHSANFCGDVMLGFKSQLNGCITLGKQLGILQGQKAILSSRLAIAEFEMALEGKPFTLEIVNSVQISLPKP